MKKLLLLMVVAMLASTSVFAEGENMANGAGSDCGDRIAKAVDADTSQDEQVKQSSVVKED